MAEAVRRHRSSLPRSGWLRGIVARECRAPAYGRCPHGYILHASPTGAWRGPGQAPRLPSAHSGRPRRQSRCSITETQTLVWSLYAVSPIEPPSDVNLTAMARRLPNTCCIRAGSTHTFGKSGCSETLSAIRFPSASVLCGAERGFDQCIEGYPLTRQREPAHFDLRQVDDVDHQFEQAPSTGLDALHIGPLPLGEGAERSPFEKLREADNPIQRRAQFVAHVGQNCVAGLLEDGPAVLRLVAGAVLAQPLRPYLSPASNIPRRNRFVCQENPSAAVVVVRFGLNLE